MFHSRAAILAGALALGSVSPLAAANNSEVDIVGIIFEPVVYGPVSEISALCGIRRTDGATFERLSMDYGLECTVARMLILNVLKQRGYLRTSFCPPDQPSFEGWRNAQLDAITDYIIVEKPAPNEPAIDVALSALVRAYPCRQTTGAK
jgi:hypothetical protein